MLDQWDNYDDKTNIFEDVLRVLDSYSFDRAYMCDEELALLRKIHRMTQSQLSDEENALLATLIGAIGAFLLRRRRWLIPLPTVTAKAYLPGSGK